MPELTRRYVVMTLATEAPFDAADPDGVFVLKPWKDPAALRALAAYRDNCYPELARDLDAWIRAIQAGPAVRGDVGTRNEPHVKTPGRHARRSAKPARGAAPPGRAAAKPRARHPSRLKKSRSSKRRKRRER